MDLLICCRAWSVPNSQMLHADSCSQHSCRWGTCDISQDLTRVACAFRLDKDKSFSHNLVCLMWRNTAQLQRCNKQPPTPLFGLLLRTTESPLPFACSIRTRGSSSMTYAHEFNPRWTWRELPTTNGSLLIFSLAQPQNLHLLVEFYNSIVKRS